jgi:NTE family protein
MKEILAQKNVHTFKDLRYADAPDGKFAYRLKVMASDVTSQSLLELPQDIAGFGMDPDDLEVALAVRMSMSIPFFFRPVVIDAKDGSATHIANPVGHKHAIVDGGVLSNFPIWTWDSTDEPAWPTFGCMLFDKGEDKPRKTTNPINLTTAIFGTMMKAHDKHFIRPDDLINRTINIPTGTVSSIDFGISQQRKGMLYKQGYDSATEFLKDWNWNRYKRWAINSRLRGL